MNVADVHGTLGRWLVADGLPVVCDLANSRGAYLRDQKTGEDFLDFFGFVGSRPLRFGHPKLLDPEFVERMSLASRYKPSNCDAYTEQYAEFVQTFAEKPLGGQFRSVFFIDGGGPAVDNAVKAAIDWKHRKNLARGLAASGNQIVHFRQGFHGRTGYALSLTDSHDIRKTQFFPLWDWPRVLNPKMTFPFDAQAQERVVQKEREARGQIEAALGRFGADIAAIIIEPIQGEGGDNYFRPEFLASLRTLADETETLLIFDEVQTGFGSTGAWWDWQHAGVRPDILVFGKKTQVCGIAATARLHEVDSVFQVPSRISSTFSGNLVDMVRCQKVIEVVEAEGLLAHVTAMGAYIQRVLEDMARSFPQVTQTRGRGAWAAFDLPSTDLRDRFVKECLHHRLIVLPSGTHSVRLRPALDIDADAIGRAGALMEAALTVVFAP